MKKFTLLTIFVICSLFIMAQIQDQIIWSEDFNETTFGAGLPDGWIVVDNTDHDYNWRWSKEGPRGRFTSPNGEMEGDSAFVPSDPIYSTTGENGFLMFEADYFNTNPSGQAVDLLVYADAYIQTPKIDFTGKNGALLRLQQALYYSGYSTNVYLSLLISNNYNPADETGTWTEFSLCTGISSGETSSNPDLREINISEVVANEPNVYLRFLVKGIPRHYWMIDDISIVEPYSNDLVLNYFWADYINKPENLAGSDSTKNWNGGYVNIPQSYADEFVSFRAAVTSMGIDNQASVNLAVNIEHDEQNVYHQESANQSLGFFSKSIFEINTAFAPIEKGHYQVSATISSGSVDAVLANNYSLYEFDITDSVYSRVPLNSENYGPISTKLIGVGVDGNNICVSFDVPDSDKKIKFSSVTTYIHPYIDTTNVESESVSIIARVYMFDETTNKYETTPLLSSENYILKTSDIGNFITLPLLYESISELNSGKYAVGFEFYTSGINMHFWIGNDYSTKQPSGNAIALLSSDWTVINANPVIILNVETPGTKIIDNGINNSFIVNQNYPNPFSKYTEISYSINQSVQVAIEVYDITGKQVYKETLGKKSVGNHVVKLSAEYFQQGIYLYKLSVGQFSQTKRMIIGY